MAKRLKITKKGNRVWNTGIFLGKTDQETWIIAQRDGTHIARSIRPLPEQHDSKRTSSIEVHTWNLRQSIFGTRLFPESKQRQKPTLLPLPAVSEEQQLQLENDEAGSDPSDSEKQEVEEEAASEGSSMSNSRNRERAFDDDTMLQELVDAQDAAPSEPRSPAHKRAADSEPAGSPTKAPRVQEGSISRAEAYGCVPHDVEVEDEDNELRFDSEEEEEVEEIEESEGEEAIKVPPEFFNKEAGPPEVDPEFLKKLDKATIDKEIKRLTRMGVTPLVATKEDEATPEVPFADTQQEVYKWPTTKIVMGWRCRESIGFEPEGDQKKEDRCWQRRARLVAREYKTEGKREDVFSAATKPGITKLVPILALLNQLAIYSVDVKDGFLQEPQRTPLPCRVPEEAMDVVQELLESWCWRLGRVLPGQRDPSSLWSDYCDELLVQAGFERSVRSPSLYRLLQGEGERTKVAAVCIVHVDDLQLAGKEHTVEPILERLRKKVRLQVEGPFLTKEDYEGGHSSSSVRLLKRKYIFEDNELKIFSDSKYSKKLAEILGLQKKKKKSKNSPCAPACQEKDDSEEFGDEASSRYRTCVGILL